MKVVVEPTGRFESFMGVECRIWKGRTESGADVEFMVPCVRSPGDKPPVPEFEAELNKVKAERRLVVSFDTRML